MHARNFQSKSGLEFFARGRRTRLNFLIKVQLGASVILGWGVPKAKSPQDDAIFGKKGKERCVTALILAKVDFFLPNFVGRKVSHLVKAATFTISRADHCVNFWQSL